MSSWLPSFLKSESYPQLHSIVNNSEKINKELDELENKNINFNVTSIRNSHQSLKTQLEKVFEILKQQPSQLTQSGGRRTKKSKHSKHSKHSKKSRKTRKSRK